MENSIILTHRSWKLVNIEKVIIVVGIIGLVTTCYESKDGVGTLSANLDQLWALQMKDFQPEVVQMIKLILWILIVVKALTKEVYIGCYVVMIYGFITGNKSIVYPWLVVSAIRSLFVEAASCFTACLICSHYRSIKFVCLDYVISRGFSLACSVSLWIAVNEMYTTETRPSSRTSRPSVPVVRSLESMLAEAVVDWFLEEAERCRTFDSKLAVDEDITMFEHGLSQRAAQFLQLKPEEILEDVRLKLDKKLPIPKAQTATQTEELPTNNELSDQTPKDTHSRSDSSINQTISEFDMEIKNPLRRFPYYQINDNLDSLRIPSDEYIADTVLGNKCVSVQTLESCSAIESNMKT